jgi:polygalacturonase
MALLLPASGRASQAWFVVMQTSTTAADTVAVSPPAGGSYSAAAQTDTGTIWNQLPYVTSTTNPANNIGNPNTGSNTGTYQLYASPRSLVDSLGQSSSVTLGVAINFAGNSAAGITALSQSNANPQAVFGGVWRQNNGANSITYTLAGLPAANTRYDVYFYACSSSTTARGATLTLDSANTVSGESASAATSGTSGTVTIFDASGNLINKGVTWNVVSAVSDASKRIVFTQSKISSGQNWFSGFQVVRRPMPPAISTQPRTGSVAFRGSTAYLTVQATGDDPLTYQWRKNGTPLADGPTASGSTIGGAGTATLAVGNVQDSDAGSYDVVITNTLGTATSTACALTVQNGVVINAPPASMISAPGQSATFSASVTGPGPITYQWYYNGVALSNGTQPDGTTISGATTTTLTLGNLASTRAGDYTLGATIPEMTATSPVASLTLVSFAGPSIPATVFYASAYGAVADGVTDCAPAINAAINAANAAGGGVVQVPSGTLLCGPITLKSRVHLRFADGSVVKMLPYGQWPGAPYATSGVKSFITAENITDIMVSGNALIDGQGQAWWDHYLGTNGVTKVTTNRPGSIITYAGVTRGAIIGISTLNPANQHFGISNVTSNLVISRCTLNAPDNSPNTDGINMAGRNIHIERCSISTGDDNIVIKSGSTNGISSDIRITGCYLGPGHGCSIGSYTNSPGIHNVTVDNMVFEGTSAGINLKSSPTRGNVIENLTYDNITMRNVAAPMGIQSYYGTVGYPGSTGSYGTYPTGTWSNTAEKFNATPPDPINSPDQLPEWRNITISNLTITGSTDYSVIWGLPNMPVRGVTLRNITQTGGPGFRIYNAENVVFAGSNSFQSNGRPLVTPYNAIVITRPPASQSAHPGDTVAFSVRSTGASGVGGNAPTYSWKRNGITLSNGTQSDGSVITGATTSTLTLAGVSSASAGDYTAVVSNMLDTYVYTNPADTTTGALVPAGRAATATSTATLTIYPQTYTLQPADALATSGGTAVFTVAASQATAIRWQISTDGGSTFADLPSASGDKLVLTGVTSSAAYRAVATTTQGDIPSNTARLSIASAVHFTATPQVNIAYRTPSLSGAAVTGAAAIGTSTSTWNNLTGATSSTTLSTQTLLNATSLVSDTGTSTSLKLTLIASSASNPMSSVLKAYNDSTSNGPVTPIFNYYTYYWYTSVLNLQISGLKPGSMYRIYGYGSGNATGQGSTWLLADANGGATMTVRADYDKGFTRSAAASNAGHSYAILNGQAGADGTLNCYVNPNPGGNDPYFNGLQLQETATDTITSQPSAQAAYTGTTATLGITAPTARAFLWQFSSDGGTTYNSLNPSVNPTAATATLQLAGVQLASDGLYRVLVADANQTISISSSARLTVTAATAPVFQTQPAGQTASPGQNVTLTATATGTPTPVFQWYKGTSPITGATSATLQLPSVTLANAGSYTVVASNSAGQTTSSGALLDIKQSYSGWAAGYGLSTATDGAPTADPDQDGAPNLLEYYCGRDPRHADISPSVVTVTPINGAIRFQHIRSKLATGLTATLRISTDLINWSPVATAPAADYSDPAFELLEATVTPLTPRIFARLEVSTP